MPPKTSMKAALRRPETGTAAETKPAMMTDAPKAHAPDPTGAAMASAARQPAMREIPPKPLSKLRATKVDPFAAAVVAAAESGQPVEIRPGYKLVKAREVLPHVSVYLHPKVIARFKEIAAVEGKKAHAVYLEALDQYLTNNHGVTLEGLSRE